MKRVLLPSPPLHQRRWKPASALIASLLVLPLFSQEELPRPKVELGIDVFATDPPKALRNLRLGLITNPSGVDSSLTPTVDRLFRQKPSTLAHLFSPEHGLRGDVKAGDDVGDSTDTRTGLPVQSLYGKTRRPTGKALERIDALIFDIQDVGSRTYTYASTLGEALHAAKDAGKPLIVLDRPNPLGGLNFEGPVQTTAHQSFIGWGPIPVTHGMTLGELARYYNSELAIGCDLHVIKMRGWSRSSVWQDTGLHWVPTSPHIPHALQAQLYVATGMIGGVTENVSEGVGTPQPFECLGAEWLDAEQLASALNSAKLPGVQFRAHSFKPFYGKFQGKTMRGVQLILKNPRSFLPLRTALTALLAIEKLAPGQMKFIDEKAFLRHWTDEGLQQLLREKASVATIEARWKPGLEDFAAKRARALLY